MDSSVPIIDSVILDCPKLERYQANTSKINYLNIDNCPLLRTVFLTYTVFLTNINFQNNPLLELVNLESTQIQSLDFSNLTNLIGIVAMYCSDLATINLTGCTNLELVAVEQCNLTVLDVTTNTSLKSIYCTQNYIVHLDVSNCLQLNELMCNYGKLSTLNMNNINLNNIWDFDASANPELTCIEVNDTALANYKWELISGEIDTQQYFSLNCGWDPVTIEEKNTVYTNHKLISIVDVLGRESKPTPNVPLFYRYDDGTVEKKLIIE